MVIDGQQILDKGIVTVPKDEYIFDIEEQIQPNGLDLRVISLYEVSGRARLPRESKMDYSNISFEKVPFKEGWASLQPQRQYLADFREVCSMKDGYSGIVIPRSSLLRVGVHATSGLWDTGWEGGLGCSLRPINPVDIEFGARLAQIIVTKSEFNGRRYDGRYQGSTSQQAFSR